MTEIWARFDAFRASAVCDYYYFTDRVALCFDGIKLSWDCFDRCTNLSSDSPVNEAVEEQKHINLIWCPI